MPSTTTIAIHKLYLRAGNNEAAVRHKADLPDPSDLRKLANLNLVELAVIAIRRI